MTAKNYYKGQRRYSSLDLNSHVSMDTREPHKKLGYLYDADRNEVTLSHTNSGEKNNLKIGPLLPSDKLVQ